MRSLDDYEQADFDQLICWRMPLQAILLYQKVTKGGINDGMKACADRRKILEERYPEMFVGPPDPDRDGAIARLREIAEPILAIENYEDCDSFNVYFIIDAITAGASREHPEYTAHRLTKGKARNLPAAIELCQELADAAGGVEFMLTDYRCRWWDRRLMR